MERKGQAAMEFLMTYGWAILAAIIAIGVLAYFGVFSPGKYVASSAVVTAPFYVNAWNAKASVGITLELKNNGGEALTITGVTVGTTCTNTANTPIAADASATIIAECDPALTAGSNFKGDITVLYTKSGSTVELTSTGSAAGKVVA